MRSKLCSFLLGVCLVMVIGCFSVCADTIDNDGKARGNPYGDCKLKKSFEADYYDCYIPYNMTYAEIGGEAIGVTWYKYSTYNHVMSDSLKSSKITSRITWENSPSNLSGCVSLLRGAKISTEEGTGLSVVTDSNGTKYYMAAFTEFLYNSGMAGSNGFPSFSSANRAQVLDVILTDGTCIHFMVADAVGQQHSNGGVSNPAYFDVIYQNSKLNYPQYSHLFHADAGHIIEIWGETANSANSFMLKYNIGNEDSQNRVAYIRMYNTYTSENPKRASGVPADVSYSLGDISGVGSSTTTVEQSSSIIVSEWELEGMPTKSSLTTGQLSIRLPVRSDLSTGQAYSVQVIKDGISLKKEADLLTLSRVAVVFLGLCLVLYSVLLILGVIFDMSNNFIDVSMVGVLTLGKLRYSDDTISLTHRGNASFKKIIFLSCAILIIGLFFVSGGVVPAIMRAILWIKDLVS